MSLLVGGGGDEGCVGFVRCCALKFGDDCAKRVARYRYDADGGGMVARGAIVAAI
jgi:hypothetical protein